MMPLFTVKPTVPALPIFFHLDCWQELRKATVADELLRNFVPVVTTLAECAQGFVIWRPGQQTALGGFKGHKSISLHLLDIASSRWHRQRPNPTPLLPPR